MSFCYDLGEVFFDCDFSSLSPDLRRSTIRSSWFPRLLDLDFCCSGSILNIIVRRDLRGIFGLALSFRSRNGR